MTNPSPVEFKEKLINHQQIIGTFLKTPSPIICEVLGLTDLQAVCVDAEHSPFDRLTLDSCIHALRSVNKPSLVRVPSAAPEHILNALDCGATGVVLPHVLSAEQAVQIVKSAHYGSGGRGYAGSSRAADYTTKLMPEHKADSAHQTTVIAQIEDVAGVDNIDEIAAVEGIDCLFIGRVDLAVSYDKESINDEKVIKAVEKVCRSGRNAGKAVGMFVSDMDEIKRWRELGASFFLLSSDHGLLLSGARSLVSQFNAS